MHPNDRLLKIGEVVAMVALSESSIYREMRRGHFPQPIRVGARAVRWWLSEILAWLARRPRAEGDLGDPGDTTNNNWEDESTEPVSRISGISGPGAPTAQRP